MAGHSPQQYNRDGDQYGHNYHRKDHAYNHADVVSLVCNYHASLLLISFDTKTLVIVVWPMIGKPYHSPS